MQLAIAIPAILSAAERRRRLIDAGQTAFRVFNGTADGVDGLVIDKFGSNWLVQCASPPAKSDLDPLFEQGVESLYWKKLTVSGKTSPEHLAGQRLSERFPVRENGLEFLIDISAGYSQGLFVDQRENRQWVKQKAAGLRVLNLFSYTCAFGVAAAAGGAAEVVNIDLSKPYLQWGRENYQLNDIATNKQDFIFGDVFNWLQRFARNGRQFDLVILDPPSFSRTKDGKSFSVQQDYNKLLQLASRVTATGGAILAFANTHKLSLTKFVSIAEEVVLAHGLTIAAASDRMQMDFCGSNYLKRLLLVGQSNSKAWQ